MCTKNSRAVYLIRIKDIYITYSYLYLNILYLRITSLNSNFFYKYLIIFLNIIICNNTNNIG